MYDWVGTAIDEAMNHKRMLKAFSVAEKPVMREYNDVNIGFTVENKTLEIGAYSLDRCILKQVSSEKYYMANLDLKGIGKEFGINEIKLKSAFKISLSESFSIQGLSCEVRMDGEDLGISVYEDTSLGSAENRILLRNGLRFCVARPQYITNYGNEDMCKISTTVPNHNKNEFYLVGIDLGTSDWDAAYRLKIGFKGGKAYIARKNFFDLMPIEEVVKKQMKLGRDI